MLQIQIFVHGQQPTGLILGDGTGGSLVASSTYGDISYQWQIQPIMD